MNGQEEPVFSVILIISFTRISEKMQAGTGKKDGDGFCYL